MRPEDNPTLYYSIEITRYEKLKKYVNRLAIHDAEKNELLDLIEDKIKELTYLWKGSLDDRKSDTNQ